LNITKNLNERSRLCCLVLVCMLSLVLVPISFSSITFFDEYIYGDTISFTSCNEEQVASNCLNGTIITSPWNETCMVHALKSTDLYCAKPLIVTKTAEYEIPLNTYIYPLLEYYTSPIDLTNPNNVTHNLLVHAILHKSLDESQMMNVLRDLRNDTYKCWPKQGCSLAQTTDILYLLNYAGYDTSHRVYQDALLYVASRQVKNSVPKTMLEIRASSEAKCELRKGVSTFQTILFSNSVENVELTLDTTAILNITCDTGFSVTLYDMDFNIISQGKSDYYSSNTSNIEYDFFTFSPKAGCIPYRENVWDHCDYKTTSKFLALKGILPEELAAGKAFLDKYLVDQRIGARLSGSDDVLTNVYAYAITKNPRLYTWILFNQRNGGSFGFSSYATLEILRVMNEKNDWTLDAASWVLDAVGGESWQDIYQDVIMYELFESNTSAIITTPLLLESSADRLKFDVFSYENMHNASRLNVVTDSALRRNVNISFTHPDIEFQYLNNTGVFLLRSTRDGLYQGIATLDGRLDVPVVFSRQPQILFEKSDMYYVVANTGTINLKAKSSSSLEVCSISFENYAIDTTYSVTDPYLEIKYEFAEYGEYPITFTYVCNGSYKQISGTDSLYVVHEQKAPIEISIKGKGTPKSPYLVRLSNKLSRDISVNVKWLGTVPTHAVPKFVDIGVGQSAQFELIQTSPTLIAENKSATLVFETLGYVTNASVLLSIVEDPLPADVPQIVVKDDISVKFILMIVGAILILFILIWVVFLKNVSIGVKQGVVEDEKPKVESVPKVIMPQIPKKKAGRAAEVFIELQRSLGKSDAVIVDELVKSGYDVDEVILVLNDLNKVEGKPQVDVSKINMPQKVSSSPSVATNVVSPSIASATDSKNYQSESKLNPQPTSSISPNLESSQTDTAKSDLEKSDAMNKLADLVNSAIKK
jgi:hypothetical protein